MHKKITENPEVLLTGRVMGDIFARVEEHNAHFERDLGTNVEEFKIELRSEVEELKTKVEGGPRERGPGAKSGPLEPQTSPSTISRPPTATNPHSHG